MSPIFKPAFYVCAVGCMLTWLALFVKHDPNSTAFLSLAISFTALARTIHGK